MIKIRSFPVSKFEDANKFLSLHAARGERGIQLHQGDIVIFYEDGLYSKSEHIAVLQGVLSDDKNKLIASQHLANTVENIITPLLPKEYKPGMSESELRDLIKKEHGVPTQAASSLANKISGLENQMFTYAAEISRLTASIKTLEKMIADVVNSK